MTDTGARKLSQAMRLTNKSIVHGNHYRNSGNTMQRNDKRTQHLSKMESYNSANRRNKSKTSKKNPSIDASLYQITRSTANNNLDDCEDGAQLKDELDHQPLNLEVTLFNQEEKKSDTKEDAKSQEDDLDPDQDGGSGGLSYEENKDDASGADGGEKVEKTGESNTPLLFSVDKDFVKNTEIVKDLITSADAKM